MIAELHAGVVNLLRREGQMTADDVAVSFEPPNREWVNSLLMPTIDFFLFDLQENTDLRRTGMQTSREGGQGTHRIPPRRFDLRYMVSVLTTEVEDEQLLLWRTLVTLLKYPELPREILPETLHALDIPITTRVVRSDEGVRLLDYWNAFGVPPRPALVYVMTVPVDLEITLRSPLVLTRTIRTTGLQTEVGADTTHRIGGVVRDREGHALAGVSVARVGSAMEGAVTNNAGEFILGHLTSGEIVLKVIRGDRELQQATFIIPSDRYDITLE